GLLHASYDGAPGGVLTGAGDGDESAGDQGAQRHLLLTGHPAQLGRLAADDGAAPLHHRQDLEDAAADVPGEALPLPGGGLDLRGAREGALGGAGGLDDVTDGDGGDPDEDDVVHGVAGGGAALDQVGDGDEGGGEGRPAPAALDGEGEHGAGGPYGRQGGP